MLQIGKSKAKRLAAEIAFLSRNREYLFRRKIIYAITPPPRLQNIGDHAQAVVIHKWFKKHYGSFPVVEVDKDEVTQFNKALRFLIRPHDIIFLHSGGNLGDRGMWSENARRKIISMFPDNEIISLPQTIYFSDTPTGKLEQERSREIYATHPKLTVIGRDKESGRIAAGLFPSAQTFSMPDFVLSLPSALSTKKNPSPKVLLCLRLDNESILSDGDRQYLASLLPYDCAFFDTTLSHQIKKPDREAVLEKTLALFRQADVVITDRYHGVIFAIICKTPCIVIKTVDHKLTAAVEDWFSDISFIKYTDKLEVTPELVEQMLAVTDFDVPDWNDIYFDKLPEMLHLDTSNQC